MAKFPWKFWRPRAPKAGEDDLAAITRRNVTAISDLYAAVDGLLRERMRRRAQIVDNMRLVYGEPADDEPPKELQILLERLKEVDHAEDRN